MSFIFMYPILLIFISMIFCEVVAQTLSASCQSRGSFGPEQTKLFMKEVFSYNKIGGELLI